MNRLSIVAPAYNEESNIRPLYQRVADAVSPLGMDWELVLVDDGSTDGTLDAMLALRNEDSRVRILNLSRNFGHEAASTAGLDAARGDFIVLMDSDLQDPPELIPDMFNTLREGYDVVLGRRPVRLGESLFKRTSSRVFGLLMRLLTKQAPPYHTGDFRIMTRPALNALLTCREHNRFIRALGAWSGFKQTAIDFERPPRESGQSKYSLAGLLDTAAMSLTAFSAAPLRLAFWIGLSVMLISILFIIKLLVQKCLGSAPGGHAFLIASIWFLGGVQCFLLGVMGEYIGRIYTECRNRPLYFVRKSWGVEPPEGEQHGTVRED